MDPKSLPGAFTDGMRALLGEEYPAFEASFDKPRFSGLRLNRAKITPEHFEKSAPFPVRRIPWTTNGYYVDYRSAPARHPWYNAGVYYLQEPSAMAPAQILPVRPGDRVLDLCAAPGGKATELGAKLGGKGVLVANEISASRAKALLRNIEQFGIGNVLVTNTSADRLAARFEAYFDAILVDAPCSGEGMFRKDIQAVKTWSEEKVRECSAIQREIILQAADMLRPGGYMVYSTCTFEPSENELILAHLLRERPDMELVRIPCTQGRESFSPAFRLRELAKAGYDIAQEYCQIDGSTYDDVNDFKTQPEMQPETGPETQPEMQSVAGPETQLKTPPEDKEAHSCAPDLSCAVRIWPHRADGEGHFIALLHKKGSGTQADHPEYDGGNGGNDCADKNGRAAESSGKRGRGEKRGRSRGGRRSGKDTPASRSGAAGQQMELVNSFLSVYAPKIEADPERIEIRSGQVYLMPEGLPAVNGLPFLRCGLYLGELKKDRFEPAQELAMALGNCVSGSGEAHEKAHGEAHGEAHGGAADDGIHVDLDAGDERLASYLRGEEICLENAGKNGWRLVCVDGFPAGWGKLAGGRLKNKLLAAWRNSL